MRRSLKIAGFVVAPIFLWAAFVVLHKESLDKGQEDFYRTSPAVAKELDAAVLLDGLSAPEGADVLQHALQVASIYESAGNGATAKQQVAALGSVELVLDEYELDCWIWGQDEAAPRKACASAARLQSLLKKNASLLERYRAMTELSHFGFSNQNSMLFINLNKLLAAQIILEAQRGKAEQGYRRWRDNFLFLNRIAGSRSNWIGKAIVLVNYGISQATLERLLFENPELVVRHKDELLSMLPSGFGIWRVEETIRGDRQMLEEQFFTQQFEWHVDKNFVRNRLYRADMVLLDTLRSASPVELEDAVQGALKPLGDRAEWTPDYLLNPLSTIASRLLIGGYPKFGTLMTAMWDKTGYNRLLRLRVLLANKSMRDMDVERHLQGSALDLFNPFRDQPMEWAAKHKVLWFGYRNCSVVREVRLPGGRFFRQDELKALGICS